MMLPTSHITEMSRNRPGCWQAVDRLRAARGHGVPDWPSWCFLPLAGSYAVLSGGGPRRLTVEEAAEIATFGALAAWRVTQGIYEFHPAVVPAIQETPLNGDIPTDVLLRLPEWCVYVRAPGAFTPLGYTAAGFFAFLEHDVNDGHGELRFVVDQPLLGLYAAPPIHLGGTLEEGLDRAKQFALRQYAGNSSVAFRNLANSSPELQAAGVGPMLNLVLYLCAKNAEIRDGSGERHAPGNPAPKLTRAGHRLFPPPRPTTWDVAWRVGPALVVAGDRAESDPPLGGGRASPRPHIRRAHWSTYWTGPRSDPQTAVLRWLAPIAVNVDEEREVVPTVRGVGDPGDAMGG